MDPSSTEHELLATFQERLGGRDHKTIAAYMGVLRNFVGWLGARPGGQPFRVELVTETAIKSYMDYLAVAGHAPRTRAKALSALRRFCRWAQDEGLLRRNPAAYVERPTVITLAPKELTEDQRYVLRSFIERQESKRLLAIFGLGYWAGLRVSEVASLRLEHCELNRRVGSIAIVDSKRGKTRTIDLHNEVRRALFAYLHENNGARDARDPDSAYVFTGNRAAWQRLHGRADHLTPQAIDHLWSKTKRRATSAEWELIRNIRFHDLRHDLAHRARAQGWSLEEIAVYLGHQTRDGTPAIATTVRYTLPSREQLKKRIKHLNG